MTFTVVTPIIQNSKIMIFSSSLMTSTPTGTHDCKLSRDINLHKLEVGLLDDCKLPIELSIQSNLLFDLFALEYQWMAAAKQCMNMHQGYVA